MSLVVSTQPADGLWASVYAGFGIRGGDVPSSGTHGSSPVRDDLAFPADWDLELTWQILSRPPTGTLVTYEDLTYTYDPPGGTVNLYTGFSYRVRGAGAALYDDVEVILIGTASPAAYTATMAALASGSTVTGFAGSYTAPVGPGPGGNYTAAMSALSSGSTVTAFAATYTMPFIDTSTEPVTVSQAKLSARVDGDELDPVIAGYIITARQLAEHETGREYVLKTKRYSYTDWPAAGHVMHVYQPSSVAVQWWDGSAWVTMAEGTDFAWGEVDQGVGIAPPVDQTWPTLGAIAIGPRVRIDVTAGSATPSADTPECVKTFIKACVSFWTDNPAEGAAGSLDEAPRLSRLLDAERLWGA